MESLITVLSKYNYIADPHGAVGFLACEEYMSAYPQSILINLETAHPSKFLNVMNNVNIDVEIPNRLKALESKKKCAILMDSDFNRFKSYLLDR